MKLKDRMSIKEKRTFIIHMYCDCGGELKYDTSDQAADLFNLMFSAIKTPNEKIKLKHKCNKCGNIVELENMYPKEETYEIGLYADNDVISNFIASDIKPKVDNDLEALGYEH